MYKRVVAKLGSDSDRTRIALYMGRSNHERAKRLLFDTLNKHIENWWDQAFEILKHIVRL